MSNLSDIATHTRAGNALMNDSDGLLKWSPHNLLTYSEQLDATGWNKASSSTVDTNVASAPDGSATADRLNFAADTNSRIEQIVTTTATDYTFSVWLRSESGTVTLTLRNAGADFTNIDVGETWALYTHTFTETDTSAFIGIKNRDATARSILAWGAHVYRSDLGGMVNNPDQPVGFETYVPTTSAAVYLPRVGHHLWNGTAWVDAGYFHESEARTNIFVSSDVSDGTKWLVGSFASGTGDADEFLLNEGTATGVKQFVADGTNRPAADGTTTMTTAIDIGYVDMQYVVVCNENNGNGFSATVDLVNGTITRAGSEGTGSYTTSTLRPMGGGYYRVSITGVPVAASQVFVVYGATSPTDARAPSYTGTSRTVKLRYPQLEAGSTPSSYIPTSGSTVTRAADTMTIPAANLPWPTEAPLAVSIQMSGTMTYADDDTSEEVSFYNWPADSNNKIEALIRTSTDPHSMRFAQAAGGVFDSAVLAPPTYSPGINVPFNIASRHGSTFINGAVAGTSLTEDTTPVALPDLSSTDMQIGSTFNGTIDLFRMWKDDITDDGIEEAST